MTARTVVELKDPAYTWLDLVHPTPEELTAIAEEYQLQPTSVADCLDPEHLPKFEAFDQYTFAILRSWDELAALVASEARVPVSFRWAGVWQDRASRRLDLVFAATASETFEQPGRSEWSLARQVALPAREAQYLSRVRPSFARDPIWIIDQENSLKAGDTIPGSKESER